MHTIITPRFDFPYHAAEKCEGADAVTFGIVGYSRGKVQGADFPSNGHAFDDDTAARVEPYFINPAYLADGLIEFLAVAPNKRSL